uniref:Uncharacterized protein n=1 Tax=Acrobeloides nanus TaxID=290746 RepID=A0A914C2N0_9BILA
MMVTTSELLTMQPALNFTIPTRKKYDYFNFEDFKNILQYTLLSKAKGYTLEALESEWKMNEPVSLELCARKFGFTSFWHLIQDDCLQDIVIIDKVVKNGIEQIIFKGVPRPEVAHLYRHMLESEKEKEINQERHNMIRASLPKYQAKCIEGKERILKIAAELGGENEPVQYQKIFENYALIYGVPLNGDELRKYFSKSKISSIFSTLFLEEVQIGQDEKNALFIQLKRPLAELKAMWEEKMKIQNKVHKNISKLELNSKKRSPFWQDVDIIDRENDKERHKIIGASLPQYQAKCIEGKKRILKIAAELGGENEPVLYQKIQVKYAQIYEVPLTGDELKKYFTRSRAMSIFSTFFSKEVQISLDEKNPGNLFIQLKRPLAELQAMWKENMEIREKA